MAESRYALTPTQRRALMDTQVAMAEAEKVVAARRADAQRVSDLILDALGLPLSTQARYDEAAGEIVVDVPEAS